ncbi:MAG: hypothetical protein HC929_03450 [Leptolyngbyaceae cyanobacterium SM2_5_2]|nr:hypothetical protein [Leptolyngbyaceae cyanobacterium SM2_5_2]
MTRSVLPPRPIVYLACQQTRLYGEVIQVLTERQRCWVRPLWLVTPDQVLTLEPALSPTAHQPTSRDFKVPT